jgi:hypothetical protein
VGSAAVQTATRLLLDKVRATNATADGEKDKPPVDWIFTANAAAARFSGMHAAAASDAHQLLLRHRHTVTYVTWHKRGDYFATVCPEGRTINFSSYSFYSYFAS